MKAKLKSKQKNIEIYNYKNFEFKIKYDQKTKLFSGYIITIDDYSGMFNQKNSCINSAIHMINAEIQLQKKELV